ncbi:MFS transporter [Reyranella sp.]|uniref:MFS transporter n=1 Tax=Reyranella sp. TaxID=1929291 RepID=UPI003BAC91BE
MPRHLPVLFILALTQIAGWGMVGLLPVMAPRVAATFGCSLPSVFLGTSVMYVTMGLAAPWAGRAFRRFGTREVMAAGAGTIGLGLALLAVSPGIALFWGAWALTGVGGALFLTTSAYAYVADYAEDRARTLIGTLMLVTGLAGSVFWPITGFLGGLVGWRGVALIYAAIMVLAICPMTRLCLPETKGSTETVPPEGRRRTGRVFVLLVAAIALNSFVTFGIEAVGIQLLQAMGMDLAGAVAIASLLGVAKVGGRLIDLLGGRRWDGLSTAIVSGAMIPLGLVAIWIGGAGTLSVAGYLALFGVGSGAFAVARATMPLVFFRKADYAAAMATIALPMNLINALAPPILAELMARIGAPVTFALLGGLSVAAFAILLLLNGMRVRPGLAP